jgi:hypothetical protein
LLISGAWALVWGTSHEIGKHHFQVEVALPPEKVSAKIMLVDKKKVLFEQTRQI